MGWGGGAQNPLVGVVRFFDKRCINVSFKSASNPFKVVITVILRPG